MSELVGLIQCRLCAWPVKSFKNATVAIEEENHLSLKDLTMADGNKFPFAVSDMDFHAKDL